MGHMILLEISLYAASLAASPPDSAPVAQLPEDDTPDWEIPTEAQEKLSQSKIRKRDEYIESALHACEHDDFDMCATHASFALQIDPHDVSAKRLRSIALYVGGRDLSKQFRPRIGPRDAARHIQVGVIAIPYQTWHGGYLVHTDFMGILLRGKTTYSVAFGPHIGVLRLRYRHPEYLELSKYGESFAGGLRLTFRLGRTFNISWHGYFDIYGQFSLGFTGATSSPIPKRSFFGHFIPGLGVSYSFGRTTLSIAAIGSWLPFIYPQNERQGFSLGVMPSLAIGF